MFLSVFVVGALVVAVAVDVAVAIVVADVVAVNRRKHFDVVVALVLGV